MDRIITFGKYRGKTIEQLAAIDWDYLCWIARESIVRDGVNYSKLASQYIDAHEDDIDVCPVCHETSCDGWHWKRR